MQILINYAINIINRINDSNLLDLFYHLKVIYFVII
jgi:hypothetical protein